MAHPEKSFVSPEEYFETEEVAEYKSEYFHGEIFAMTGASFNHNVISSNLVVFLGNQLRNSCFVFSGDMKIQLDEDKHYAYPDLSVVCGEPEFAKERNDIITNPLVIMEILSKSTRDYDRGSKFTAYRNIASLKDYILVDQYAYHVEYFHKEAHQKWIFEEFKDLSDTFRISSLDMELSLNTIYHRVEMGDSGCW